MELLNLAINNLVNSTNKVLELMTPEQQKYYLAKQEEEILTELRKIMAEKKLQDL